MSQSIWTIMHKTYRTQGPCAVAALGLKKILRPVAKVGSLYFLERDLSTPMPLLNSTRTVEAREGTLVDIHLLDVMSGAARHKSEAIERLKRGDRWFIGIDQASGKLASHRWVSLTRSFIPELGRDVILKPGQAYLYDLETTPEFRRHGIEAIVRHYTYNTLWSNGVQRILVYIRADNYASLQAARNYLTPICRVWFVHMHGGAYMFARNRDKLPELGTSTKANVQAAFRARPSSSLR